MFPRRALQLCAATAAVARATNLFVSDYGGKVTTLSLTESAGSYSLVQTSASTGCAPNPSWLTLDASHGTLYCLDEGLDVTNGSLSSYTIGSDGKLTQVMRASTISSPVSGVIFGNPAKQRAIALAHYGSSAISTWSLDANHTGPGAFALEQEIVIPDFTTPGANPDRQNNPHEHEAVLDPTGAFIIVPDLGADLVRVYSIGSDNELRTETPLKVAAGSGPRHVAFYSPYGVVGGGSATYMFLVSELANTVTSFAVTYPQSGGMSFEQVYQSTSYGSLPLPEGNAVAELEISPDNRFLTISNRNNTSFHIPSTSSDNTTQIPSDSLSTFAIHPNGTLSFLQLWPSGGVYPRQFSMNAYGDLIAVGMQFDKSVVIMERDVVSGLVGKQVAKWQGEGNVTCVVWE